MIFDLQKASFWKRISAYLFDGIILSVFVVGVAAVLSMAFGYDRYRDTLSQCYAQYEKQFEISFDLSQDEYNTLPPVEQQRYDDVLSILQKDQTINYAYSMIINLTLLIATFSILLGYLILELAVPLKLGNGQTLGKKIFGIGVMRTDGVKINTVMLFIRTILGKFTIETMIPVLTAMMIFFGMIGLAGTILVGGLLLIQIVLLAATRTNSMIHDLLANTVVIDVASQMIFETEDDMIAYKQKIHAESAARQKY